MLAVRRAVRARSAGRLDFAQICCSWRAVEKVIRKSVQKTARPSRFGGGADAGCSRWRIRPRSTSGDDFEITCGPVGAVWERLGEFEGHRAGDRAHLPPVL